MKDDYTISLLNEISELVYIADPVTYELLFINQTGIEQLGLKDYHKQKCYQVLQNNDAPCTFCTNDKLSMHQFYNWEITNVITKRHYLLKDKFINWLGKQARLEIAFDITDREQQKLKLQNILDTQNLILQCVKKLYLATDLNKALNAILQKIGEFLHSDRVYIFKIENDLMYNTYEWCAPQVTPQIKNLQGLELSLIDEWQPAFKNMQCFSISDLETIRESCPKAYAVLAAQDIQSLIVAPIYLDNRLCGYLGIDNYDVDKLQNSTDLMLSLSIFIAYAIRHAKNMQLLYNLSHYDLLTGALNRNAFIETTTNFDPAGCTSVGVIYIDVNGMKEINDKYGHHQGDTILIQTAKDVSAIFDFNNLYRIGGDEFVVIDVNHSEAEFSDKVNQLRHLYRDQKLENYKIAIGACWSVDPAELKLLLLRADSKMYSDKKDYYYSKEKPKRYRHYLDDVLDLTNPETLKQALKNGNFSLYFQPKISLLDDQYIGAEALVRYQTESGQLILPDNFIPLLEECRLIKALDLYVFEKVCQQIVEWQRQGLQVKPIAVNLSRNTLSHPDLAEQLFAIVSKYQIDLHLLELEVTETIEAEDNFHFSHALEELKSKGFSISIDDFGVRNANLSLFTNIDFDILKLDQSLISGIVHNEKACILIRSLSLICKDLGIKLIAEGVETEEQMELLKKLECNEVQGYLFSQPLSVDNFAGKYMQR